MTHLMDQQKNKLQELLLALIDQENAHVLVEPNERKTGFWFGGGNMVKDDSDVLWVAGRFRNFGDSRTGLAAGERGLECALFASEDNGQSFSRRMSWSKADLSRPDARVLSIEGTSLHKRQDGRWELFVSSEKEWEYPESLSEFRKPGAGVWSIDVMTGADIQSLGKDSLQEVLRESRDGAYLHIKDPVVYDAPDGATHLVFCSHPYCWTCANSGLAVRTPDQDEFHLATQHLAQRGATWDVAGTRITCRMPIPQVGTFEDAPPMSVYFYDGLECVRQHDENRSAVSRPRGYSCEEISGALVGVDSEFPAMERLSYLHPLFISPWGTGASRYADVLVLENGLFASWEQSQDDLSQPLVGHFLEMADVERILS